ncbi:MAG: glycosyltransferase [Lachnospiraceae bacterium]|nr:glycosyltransferase [Lachnospiraceae bacterium]
MSIGAAMIIKRGECGELERCLNSLDGHVAEIVAVVDPAPMDGDRTDEILASHGAREILLPWPKDYSAARNESLRHISADWVLVIDTDEYIREFDVDEALLSSDIYRVTRENEYKEEDKAMLGIERITRFFRNGLFHYEGRVHEQVVSDTGDPYSAKDICITLGHTGYVDRAQMLEKSVLYRDLLYQMTKEDGEDPYLYFQIGRTYYVEKNYIDAAAAFEKAIDTGADTKDEYVESLIETYGYCLLELGRSKDALALTGFDEYADSADYHFMNGLIYMNNASFDKAVSEFETATSCKKVAVSGTDSYAAYYNCGVIYEVLGDKVRAADYYRKSGDYPPAIAGLSRL